MSDSKIHKAIIAVMREVGPIGKDSRNEQQKFNYRSVAAVYNRVHPLFAKHGIFSYPGKVLDQIRETGKSRSGGDLHYAVLTIEYTFAAEDGSSIAVTVVGEGMDPGDKASNKAMAAAHKYALCQVLNIPYQVTDPDAYTPETHDGITQNQLTGLKNGWGSNNPDKVNGLDKPEVRKHFDQWLTEIIGDHNPDMLAEMDGYRHWSTEDLKKCQDARPFAAAKAIASYDYHLQAPFYKDVLTWASPENPPSGFAFIFVEEQPPHAVGVYVLNSDDEERGRNEYRRLLGVYHDCKQSGDWPAYATEAQYIDLPEWKRFEIDQRSVDDE